MYIKLENIGIIKDSTLVLDGLTVITGKNNSGKTTVGKTLYAMLEATSNLQQKAYTDRILYILKQLDDVKRTLTVRFRFDDDTADISSFYEYPALRTLMFEEFSDTVSEQELEFFAHTLERDLRNVDSALMESHQIPRLIRRYHGDTGTWEAINTPVKFEGYRKRALDILAQLFFALDKDPKLNDYARESINQTLRVEFGSQIQPVRTPDVMSSVALLEDGTDGAVYFHFSITNNNIINDGTPVFSASPFEKVYMIDDPFVLDKANTRSMSRLSLRKEPPETILNFTRIQPHNDKLRSALRDTDEVNIFEKMILEDSLRSIKEQIDRVIPGTFEFSNEGDYYIQNDAKIKIGNLATGSKMFSILKILLEKGDLDRSTMLILDEPEAHLHPQWQNVFAEIIVLLVKEVGVHVLLTTHSPNFMLALDAHMRKYHINDQTNFYQTDTMDNGFVQYHCVNDDMGRIYDDFLRYLSEMKALRSQYLYGGGESV